MMRISGKFSQPLKQHTFRMESNVSQYTYITMSWYLMSDNLISLKPLSLEVQDQTQNGLWDDPCKGFPILPMGKVRSTWTSWDLFLSSPNFLRFTYFPFGPWPVWKSLPAEWTVDQLPSYHLRRHPKTWNGFGSSQGFLTPSQRVWYGMPGSLPQKTYTTWKVDGTTPMYWFIIAPY